MSWTLLVALVAALGVALLVAIARRNELAHMRARVSKRERAVRSGADKAQLQHPVVDLSRCLGCGTCVAACPEEGVLELVHGQAVVVNGARCVGHAACERECPVGAITVTLANLEERRDVPALTHELEAIGSPGLFLAGEITAHALIKNAILQGTSVAAEVARRVNDGARGDGEELLDLCVVGAGPAGLACSLEAKRHGLHFVTIDQESGAGGTVAKYPRRKLVVMQPVELPLHGLLGRTEFTKEELVELWQRVAEEQELPLHSGETLEGVERAPDGTFRVHTSVGVHHARHVCLAIGRRGTPRKLDVPGEELPKVAYSLLDANSYTGRRLVVVGGGDSAVETALALAEQPGNEVTLSYRQGEFHRIRKRNEARLQIALEENRLQVAHHSQLVSIEDDEVVLEFGEQAEGGARREALANDEVFVMAGGIAPFERLEHAGVSFDPTLREPVAPLQEQGSGLLPALGVAFALALVALIFALWNIDYYMLAPEQRAQDVRHVWLRSGRGVGLALGIAATAMVLFNLLYLVRRNGGRFQRMGSLQIWMNSHMVTGIVALLAAMLHAAMSPRDTVGGHALWALALLLVTGAIGRYFYAWVPRAANGRELALEEVRARLDHFVEQWEAHERGFLGRVRRELAQLIEARQWKSSFFGRVGALFFGQRELRHSLTRMAELGRAEGLPEARIEEVLHLARQAHRSALAAAHLEDLRAVLNTWRYLHRWVAALMVLLMVLHVAYILAYTQGLSD